MTNKTDSSTTAANHADISSLLEFSRKSISDLGVIFSTILSKTETDSQEHRLAGIGTYLAGDYASLVESMQTELEANLEGQ